MREIKFRAWDEQKGMSYSYNKNSHSLSKFFKMIEFHQPKYLMQFTGIKDKNGVEIYEGDVVEILSGTKSFSIKRTKEVIMYNVKIPGFTSQEIKYYKQQRTLSRLGILYCEIEFIGNIYENPELMTDGV